MEHKREQEAASLPYFGIHKLAPYLRPYRFTMTAMIILGLLGGFVDIVLPLFQEYAIDHFIVQQDLDSMGAFIAAYAAVLMFQVAANGISAYQACEIEMYVGRDMKRISFNHLQTLAFSYFNRNSVGRSCIMESDEWDLVYFLYHWCCLCNAFRQCRAGFLGTDARAATHRGGGFFSKAAGKD